MLTAEDTPRNIGPKKPLTKRQAITLMSIGGLLLLLAIVIPTEQGSTVQMVKVGVGIVGFCGFCAGAYLRPMPPKT